MTLEQRILRMHQESSGGHETPQDTPTSDAIAPLESEGIPGPAPNNGPHPNGKGTQCVDAPAVLEDFWRRKEADAARPDLASVAVSRPLQLGDLQSFILKEVPYGETKIDNVQDEVKYDGPNLPDDIVVPDKDQRPPLYWYFDGLLYKIERALSLTYTYQRKDATGQYITAPDSIYVGFEAGYDDTGNYVPSGPEKPPLLREQHYTRPVAVPITRRSGAHKLQEWLITELRELGFNDFARAQTGWVDYAGPARDFISTRPFDMSLLQLIEIPDEFSKLLSWHIDGKQHRVAKAMRIHFLDKQCRLRAILIGFQGGFGSGPG